jgi:hypothetical protein
LLDTGELSRGILLPDEFGQSIKAALQQATKSKSGVK